MPILTYWEASGDTAVKLRELLDRREELMKPLEAFCEKHGGNLLYSDGICFRTGLGIKPKKYDNGVTEHPEPKNASLWKRVKGHDDAWVPRLSTKEGKALGKEFDTLTRPVPTRIDVGKIIGLQPWGLSGLYETTPQIYRIKKRTVLVIPTDKYKPKKDVKLKRICDLDFDKLFKDGKVFKKDAIL